MNSDLKEVQNNISQIKLNENNAEDKIKIKIPLKDGGYYIGEVIPSGKGIEYYKDGSIKYEGDWVNGKREGNGKAVYKNGDYYIGSFKNNFRDGKGIEYYKNGNIRYEGDWVGGKKEGYGKKIDEDGEYYIGQWKNNIRHGKGVDYSKDGKIIFEGDYVNGMFEGNGILYISEGKYIGQFKDGLYHGKGKLYNEKGILVYEGDFIIFLCFH